MNGAFWHVATNHIPVIGMPFAMFLLLAGLVRGSREVIRISFMAIVAIALLTILVDQTGDLAAHIVRDYPGVTRADIHEHEEAADGAFAATEVTGALALIGLWMTRGGAASTPITVLVLIGTLVSSGWLGWVGHLGGLIRHPEIKFGATAPQAASAAPQKASSKSEE